MGSAHPFSVSFAPCFQAVLCRSQLFFRMFLDRLFQICADRFIMKQKRRCFSPFLLSPSSRRAWIEILSAPQLRLAAWSPSSRRAWIEMTARRPSRVCWQVALLAEGVDRNDRGRRRCWPPTQSPSSRRAWIEMPALMRRIKTSCVALLAEGVDRNPSLFFLFRTSYTVALLAEGVDRNKAVLYKDGKAYASPSSRRAWIEMLSFAFCRCGTLGRPPRGGRG